MKTVSAIRNSQVLKSFNEAVVFEYIMLVVVAVGVLGAFAPLGVA